MMIKRVILSFILAFLATAGCFAHNWGNAQWIWQQEDGPSNTWVSFRKTVNIDEIPESVNAQISVDSKYWLWVNGEMVIFEGGFARGPSQAGAWNRKDSIMPTNSWYETINIKPYLKEGENTIAILVWYWGRMTHKGTHVDSKKGGLLFHAQIGNQTIVSDHSWKMKQHPGYDNTIPPASESLVQYPVKFDAQKAMNDWSENAWYTSGYDDTQWSSAIDKGIAGTAPWYNLIENYVPRLIDHGLVDYENNAGLNMPFISTGLTYECILPFNKQITPYLEIEAEAGKTITIITDNRLNKITATYITKGGTQAFESFSWMNGHKILYTIPQGVKVKALKYRWMSVGEMSGSYEVSDSFYQRLWEMGNNTLFVCARDNFMDCPDRERALWIGDVADQTGYLFYCMDNAGHKLLKKAILQTVYFSENKVLGALGPSRVRELVGQSLQFIAQVVWPYYFNTGDVETLEIAYPYVYDYLALFPMGSNGLPVYRKGQSPDSWDWLDWGTEGTIDKTPIQAAYYYQALIEALKMAETLGKTEHIDFYTNRVNSIKENYDKVFWKNGFYSSNISLFKDDRANALAITSGIAKPENYEAIVKNVLVPNKYCSPHFEWVAEEAMFIAGKYEESLARMKAQYNSQVSSGLSTLYENFPKGGSYNHAWNGSNTILSKYVAGIQPLDVAWSSYAVCPNLVHMTQLKTKVPTLKGDILLEVNRTDSLFKLNLESPASTLAIVGIPKHGTDVIEVTVGGQIIWKDKTFFNQVPGVSFDSEDENFLKFKVTPGAWSFIASIQPEIIDQAPEISFIAPENNTKSKLIVYPNPSSTGKFNVRYPFGQKWVIYNILGVKVLSGQGIKVDLSVFSKGLYHLIMNNTHSALLYE
jgi:alpha-L-rhamnosidase